MNGYGIHHYPDGSRYNGEWKDNNMNGYGEFIWSDGKAYIGNYVNDKKEGFGMLSINECYFIGFWKGGKQNGIGRELKRDKEKMGVWKDGRKIKNIISKEELIIEGNLKENEYKKWFLSDIKIIDDFFDKVIKE